MFRPRTLLLALAAVSTALVAEDFGPVVKVAGLIFPGSTHFGVVCHYGHSQQAVNDLLRALPEGSTLTVVDVRHPSMLGAAATALIQRDVQLMAILPADLIVRDGSAHTTGLVRNLQKTIPAFGTTPAAIQNGCALALGPATGWELMLNPNLLDPNLKGIIGPVEVTPTTKTSRNTFGSPIPVNLFVVSLNR